MDEATLKVVLIVIGASATSGIGAYLLFSALKAFRPTRRLVCLPPHVPCCCDKETDEEVKTALAETVLAGQAMDKLANRHA